MEWHGLTSREWATVFWLVVLVSVCIVIPSVRGVACPGGAQPQRLPEGAGLI